MQVKIEPMSHLPFHYFWRRAALFNPIVNIIPCQTERLDLVDLRVWARLCSCLFSVRRAFSLTARWQMKRRLRPCGCRVTQQPCEVVAVTSTPHCTLAGRGATVQPDYRVAPLPPIFLTPRMKEWQYLWDKPVWNEMDLHMRAWVAYLNRKEEARES